jgi:diguanylate cyclase (GGDEF)-like protein/PAS domain S-box-containing protein
MFSWPFAGGSPELRAEQLAQLKQQLPLDVIAHLSAAMLMLATLHGVMAGGSLQAWFAAVIGLGVLRLATRPLWDRPGPAGDRLRLAAVLAGALAAGALWGWAGLAFHPGGSPAHQFFVLLTLVSLAGASLITLAACPWAFAAFVLPALAPCTLHLLWSDRHLDRPMGVLALLLLGLLFIGLRRSYEAAGRRHGERRERERLLARLDDANRMLERMFDTTEVLFAYLDCDFRFLRVNQAYAAASGHTPEFFLSQDHFALYPDAENQAIFRHVVASGEPYRAKAKPFEYPDHPERGLTYWDWSLYPLRDADGRVEALLLAMIDVTAGKRAELAAQEKETYLRTVMQTALDAIVTADEHGRIEMVNPAVEAVFGYRAEELPGQSINLLMPEVLARGAHDEYMRRHGEGATRPLVSRRIETSGRRKNGESFPLEVTVSESRVHERRVYTAVLRDIGERQKTMHALDEARRKAEAALAELAEKNAQLSYLSSHDELTGLYNRRYFDLQLDREWRRAARHGEDLALILIDIDHFKDYNDHYGHQAGDLCLRQIAQLLAAGLKRPGDFIARYGGEEFVAVLPDTSPAGACRIAEAMRQAVQAAHYPHARSPVAGCVTISLGIGAVRPSAAQSPAPLVAAADRALYAAKQGGRNRVCGEGCAADAA